ncbi:hypothetical protein NL529_30500, partial [Klebsiella pneumoniae]|nr:hypothetical protein [Klebsiella pneumoniae]
VTGPITVTGPVTLADPADEQGPVDPPRRQEPWAALRHGLLRGLLVIGLVTVTAGAWRALTPSGAWPPLRLLTPSRPADPGATFPPG